VIPKHTGVGLFLVSALTCNCGAGPSKPAREPSATAAAAVSSQPTGSVAQAAESILKADSPQTPDSSESDQRLDTVEGWLASKGIKDISSESLIRLAALPASVHVECDRLFPVGKPVGQAVLCRRQFMEGDWELGTSFLLLVPNQTRLRVVWEARSAAGTLSKTNVSEDPWVQLSISVQDDGQVLFLEEVASLSCSDAKKRAAQERKQAEKQDMASIDVMERSVGRVCQARGKYAWRGSTFVRVSGPIPIARLPSGA